MFRSRKRIAVAVIAAAAALAFSASTAAAGGARPTRPAGYVYTLTNSPTDNQVVTFDRGADGSLVQQGTTSTNGTGTGAGLGSQGALALDGDHLFAVNAASNTISEFDVGHGDTRAAHDRRVGWHHADQPDRPPPRAVRAQRRRHREHHRLPRRPPQT